MKKQIFYRILLLFFICSGNVFANETFSLVPNLQPGDQWKMQFTYFKKDKAMNFDKKDLIASMHPNDVASVNWGSQYKSTWQVECLAATDSSIQIKTTLLRIQIVEDLGNINNYFDSKYPLNLSDEVMLQMDSVIGQSCSFDLNFKTDSVTLLHNTFNKENSNLQMFSFMNMQRTSDLFSVTYSYDMGKQFGPEFLSIPFTIWTFVIPSENISDTSTWFMNNDQVEKKYPVHINNENDLSRTIVVHQNQDGSFKLYKHNNVLAAFQLGKDVSGFTYDFKPQPNVAVSGSFAKTSTEGMITMESRFPVVSKTVTAKVEDGTFEIPIDVSEPTTYTLKYKDQHIPLFLAPGSDIKINWDEKGQYSFVDYDNKAIEAFRDIYFSGVNSFKTASEIREVTKVYQNKVDECIKHYRDSCSDHALAYLKTERDYFIAKRYLEVIEDIERSKYGKITDAELAQLEGSSNFMIHYLDSLPTVGDISLASPSYHDFLINNMVIQQRRFLKQRGRRRKNATLDENLFFAQMQYIGYPQYYCRYHLLESGLKEGNTKAVDRHLPDFYDLPIAANFSDELKALREKVRLIEVGSPFPFELISMGQSRPLPKMDGELTVVNVFKSYWMGQSTQHAPQKEELTRIMKENPNIDHINYIAVHQLDYKGMFDETPRNDTVDISYVYLSKENWEHLASKLSVDNYRVFLLGKSQEILDNNVGDIREYSSNRFREDLKEYFKSPKAETNEAGISKKALLIIFTLALLFGLISWGTIKIRSQRIARREAKKRQLKELELKAIRSQMNPHFIFNAMGSIQNLINQNKIKEANLYLASFAKLMRLVLNTSDKKLVSLSDEIALVQHYLSLEQLRVAFEFSIEVENNIVPDNEEVPGMLIQPFVENAVIHGITPKGGGTIQVKFKKQAQNLICIISDDGVGIKQTTSENGNGMALKLAQKRVDLLNESEGNAVNLEVFDRCRNKGETGTKVKLMIPIA